MRARYIILDRASWTNLQFYEFNCRIVDSAEIAVYHPVIIDSIVLAHIQRCIAGTVYCGTPFRLPSQ